MASYKVRMADESGEIKTESMQAESVEEIVSLIRDKNLFPVKISEESIIDKDLDFSSMFKQKVKVSDLAVFCRQLSAMLSAGMPINRALDIQEVQTENAAVKEAIKSVSSGIKQGDSISRSMREHPAVFPPILINMVESGESTGNLDDVLERMANHFISENRTTNAIKGAMAYPMILLILMIGILFGLMLFVVPMFQTQFSSAGQKLPLISRIVFGLSGFMMKYILVIIVIIAAAILWFLQYRKSPKGRYKLDELKLNMPILGKNMRQIVTARFTRTLATLLASGVSIVDALNISAETTNNVLIVDALSIATDGIKRGMSLTAELRKIEYFPLMMVSMVGIGEETGALDTLLIKTADYYDEELEAAIKRLLGMMEPIMIIVLGLVVGCVVVAVMLPMFDMNSGSTM